MEWNWLIYNCYFIFTLMKISYNWLKDLLEFDLNVEETSKLLTDIGLEVEKTQIYN